MATKTTNKTVKKSVTQKPNEGKVNVNSTDLVEENASLKKELNEMMQNYKEMQLQLQNMLLAQQTQALSNTKSGDGTAIVGCRIFNGATLSSQGGDISIFIQYQDEEEITYSELKEIFKSPFNFKNMFKKGILYFVNKEDYVRFGIKPEIDLSDEALIDLLSNERPTDIVDYVSKI